MTEERALQYRLVDLMKEAAGDPEVLQSIMTIVTWLQTRRTEEKEEME